MQGAYVRMCGGMGIMYGHASGWIYTGKRGAFRRNPESASLFLVGKWEQSFERTAFWGLAVVYCCRCNDKRRKTQGSVLCVFRLFCLERVAYAE